MAEAHAKSLSRYCPEILSTLHTLPKACPKLVNTTHAIKSLSKSDCITATIAIHCVYLLAQQLNATCQLPVELHPVFSAMQIKTDSR